MKASTPARAADETGLTIQAPALGKSLGLEAIDLSILFVPDRSPATSARLRREIEAAQMRVAMLTSYPHFTHPDPARRERELEMECSVVAVAHAGLFPLGGTGGARRCPPSTSASRIGCARPTACQSCPTH
jgi:hypothetical protein